MTGIEIGTFNGVAFLQSRYQKRSATTWDQGLRHRSILLHRTGHLMSLLFIPIL